MARKNSWGFRKVNWPIIIILFLLTIVLGYYAAAGAAPGVTIFIWIENMKPVLNNPFRFYWNEFSLPCIGGAVVCFWLWFLYYLTSAKNYMRGKEFGTSHFQEASELNKKLADLNNSPKDEHNIVVERKRLLGRTEHLVVNTRNRMLSQNLQMTLNTRHTDLNNNMLIVGGSGAAKTFRMAKPILMQMSSSYVVTDPKGELTRDTAGLMKKYDYVVKVINLLNAKGMKKSVKYNPFRYVMNDMDIVKMVTTFMEATKKKGATTGEQIWDDLASLLLQALFFYVYDKGIEVDGQIHHDFKGVMKLVNMLKVEEDPQTGQRKKTEIDYIFGNLERENPSHQAVLNYNKVMVGAADTVRSIISTVNSRTTCLQTEEVLDLLSDDEIDITSIGARKTIVYCIIPDNDRTFNFIPSLLYQQMIQQLYYQADFVYGGRLPVHVTYLLDEFANVSISEEYTSWLSTMRSREMSSIIIIQNMAQLKSMFKDTWETVPGNCDTFIYLGGNEQSTHKYINELLGNETIDKQTHGVTKGQHGSTSANDDVVGRALMLPDEVRKMSRKKCLVIIAGHDPVIDYKINTPKHPLWKEMNRLAKHYSFDGRLERLSTGKIVIRDKERDDVELASIRLVEQTRVDILRAEDERNQDEYESEKRVAELTGDAMPEKPVKRVIDVSLEELLEMAVEQGVLDNETEEQMKTMLSETSLEDMEDGIEDALYECAGEGSQSLRYYEMVEEEEVEENLGETENVLGREVSFQETEEKAKMFKKLLRYGYNSEQMKLIFPLTAKYSVERINNMFAPDMDAPTISLMIELLGEI